MNHCYHHLCEKETCCWCIAPTGAPFSWNLQVTVYRNVFLNFCINVGG